VTISQKELPSIDPAEKSSKGGSRNSSDSLQNTFNACVTSDSLQNTFEACAIFAIDSRQISGRPTRNGRHTTKVAHS